MNIFITVALAISLISGWIIGYHAGVKDGHYENCEDYQ